MLTAETRLDDGGELVEGGAGVESSNLVALNVAPSVVNTGMVWCPVRMSHLAVMKCFSNQTRHGCALGCANAVTKREVQLTVSRSSSYVENEEQIGRVFCIDCGNPKKGRTGLRCRRCGGRIAARWRLRGSAAEVPKEA